MSGTAGGTGLGVRDGAVRLEFGRLPRWVIVPAEGECAGAAGEASPG